MELAARTEFEWRGLGDTLRLSSLQFAERSDAIGARVIGECRRNVSNATTGSVFPENGDYFRKIGFIPAGAGQR